MLRTNDVHLRFGGVVALSGVSFTVEPETICGLIGPNGAGKTALLNCITGLYRPQRGEIEFEGRSLRGLEPHQIARAGLSRTFQNLGLFPSMTVLQNVLVGSVRPNSTSYIAEVLRIRSLPSQRAERSDRARAVELLERLDLLDVAEHRADGLPFGTLKRVELARSLMGSPRLLLLDEPANGLNGAEVMALADLVLELKREAGFSILLVEHHMGMVMRIADQIVVLNFGQTIGDGPPDEVRRMPAVLEAYLGTSA